MTVPYKSDGVWQASKKVERANTHSSKKHFEITPLFDYPWWTFTKPGHAGVPPDGSIRYLTEYPPECPEQQLSVSFSVATFSGNLGGRVFMVLSPSCPNFIGY